MNYTQNEECWKLLRASIVGAIAGKVFIRPAEATPFVDDLYDHHIEYVHGLDKDRLVEFVKHIDPELLKMVEV